MLHYNDMELITNRFLCRKEKWGYLLQDIMHDRLWAIDENVLDEIKKGNTKIPVFSDLPYQHKGGFELGDLQFRDSLSSPISVSWSLTKNCNSNCIFCCTDSINGEIVKSDTDISNIEKVLKTILQWNVLRIIIGGGEPLMREDILDVLSLFRKYNFKPVIATNGILLEGVIREAVINTCMNIQVSLDTLDEELYYKLRGVNALECVKNNVYFTAKAGICMRIVTVVTNENIDELLDLAKFIHSCGIKQWFIFDLLEAGRGKNCYQELYLKNKGRMVLLLERVKYQYPDISVWFWGNKKADGCAVYVLPDGSLGLTDYHTDNTRVFSAEELNLETVCMFWDSVQIEDKQKILDNFLSSNRLER